MLTALRDSKRMGASIIGINPLIEAGMLRFKHPQNPLEVLGYGNEISDEHIRVKINGDQALFRGFAKIILTNSDQDMEFIDSYSEDMKSTVQRYWAPVGKKLSKYVVLKDPKFRGSENYWGNQSLLSVAGLWA